MHHRVLQGEGEAGGVARRVSGGHHSVGGCTPFLVCVELEISLGSSPWDGTFLWIPTALEMGWGWHWGWDGGGIGIGMATE